MRLSLHIARRYFFSKKKRNFIDIISRVSMISLAIGAMALIVVLSVFNGIETLIRQIYGSIDPDLTISLNEGKTFEVTDALKEKVSGTEGVALVTEVLEDIAVCSFRGRLASVRLNGVDSTFHHQNDLASATVYGNFKLSDSNSNYAVIGRGIQYTLSIDPDEKYHPLEFRYPRNTKNIPSNPQNALNRAFVLPSGVFALEQTYDQSYVFVPIAVTRKLFDKPGQCSSLQVKVADGARVRDVQQKLTAVLGDRFKVQSVEELHESLLRASKIEKLFAFIAFIFILGVASINIFFSLSMLTLEKQRDIAVLKALGAPQRLIRNIFLTEGAIIGVIGAVIGITIGSIIVLLQERFGFVSMGMTTSIVDAYPVELQPWDIVYTLAAIIFITAAASLPPAIRAANMEDSLS